MHCAQALYDQQLPSRRLVQTQRRKRTFARGMEPGDGATSAAEDAPSPTTLPEGPLVLLTGATGFLGAFLLAQLVPYCLGRRVHRESPHGKAVGSDRGSGAVVVAIREVQRRLAHTLRQSVSPFS